MRWVRIAWPAAVLCLLIVGPLAAAQEEPLVVDAIDVSNTDGKVLTSPGLYKLVQIVGTIRYTDENESLSRAPIEVSLSIAAPDGSTEEKSRFLVPNRTVNGTVDIVFDWRPTQEGLHDITITLAAIDASWSRNITVRAQEVQQATLGERLMDFPLVLLTFGTAAVAFVVMVAARRRS